MAARANEAAGLFRTVEFLKQIANDTQDPSVMDTIDMDVAGPEVAQINGVPARWIADDQKVAAKRKAREIQRQQEMQIQAAPAQAAMMKATAAQVKVGMQPGQQVGPPPGV
jgi:adenylate kinase